MKKFLLLLVSIMFCFFFSAINETRAQEPISDTQQVQEPPQEMDQDTQVAARVEENKLREQIKAAVDSGDLQTAQQLRQQLKAMHIENIDAMMKDGQEMHSAGQDNNPPAPKGGPGIN